MISFSTKRSLLIRGVTRGHSRVGSAYPRFFLPTLKKCLPTLEKKGPTPAEILVTRLLLMQKSKSVSEQQTYLRTYLISGRKSWTMKITVLFKQTVRHFYMA